MQYNPSKVLQLPYPTNDTRVIVKTAQEALRAIFRKDYFYHKAGVMMLDLTDKDVEQFDLFNASQDSEERIKSDRLMSTIDKINNKMGKSTIVIGGHKTNAAWNPKRDFLNQRYTTGWNELLSVKL